MTTGLPLARAAFGDSPALADALLALVLAGTKTATCWRAADGVKGTAVGRRWIVLDGTGAPRAIVETVELTERRFAAVDAAFAWDEGEGDRSLDQWRQGHQAFFARTGGFAPDMALWCERFRLVSTL